MPAPAIFALSRLRPIAESTAVVLILAGCAVGPDYKRPAPALPQSWSPAAATAATRTGASISGAVDQAWWAAFGDPELSSLVERTVAANLDLKQADARIRQARATRDVAAADRWPQISANAGYTTNRLSDNTPTGALFSRFGGGKSPLGPGVSIPNPYDQFQLGFDATWEIDLFGRVRRGVEAADADRTTAMAQRDDLKLSLAAEVARTYFDLRAQQQRRSISKDSIATARELVDLARQRRAAGLSSAADVADAEAEALTNEAQLPAIERQITQDINALSRLIGREPDALRAELRADAPLPAAAPSIPTGLPSDLARRRPDIRAAEARLHAATARVGVATAALFPKVSLGGPAALQSERLATLTDWASRFYQVGPSIQVPIFDGGRDRASVRLSKAEAEEAAFAYRGAVLTAMHDVENALAAGAADAETRRTLAAAVARGRDAMGLAQDRYERGLGSFIAVLDARRTLLTNELALAQSAQAEAVDAVALYKALGGGWSAPKV